VLINVLIRSFFYRQDAVKRQTAGIKFTHRPKMRFSPRKGDSLHRFTSKLAGPTGTGVRLVVQNFTSIGIGGGNAAPTYEKFPLFGKESPHRDEPLDRFLKFYGFLYAQLSCIRLLFQI